MDETQNAFHMEEYKQIKGEVSGLLARVENLFKYSLVVTATIYAWLIVKSVGLTDKSAICIKLPIELLRPGWLIPPVFIALSGLLAFAAYWRVNQMGAYLKSIESDIGSPSLGWEKYLGAKCPIVTSAAIAVWVLLFAASWYGTSEGIRSIQGNPPACKTESTKLP